MPRYIFVFDSRTDSFPERYRVITPGEAADHLRAQEDLTGTVPSAAADAVLEALVEQYPPDSPLRAESVHASNWGMVARSYAGLFRD